MTRSPSSLLPLLALSSLALSALPSAAPCQTVTLIQTPEGVGLDLGVFVVGPVSNEKLMLVGYVGVVEDPETPVTTAQQIWSTVPALLHVSESLMDYKNLFGPNGSNSLTDELTSASASFGIPRGNVEEVLQDFYDYSQLTSFEIARAQLTEQWNSTPVYPWRGFAPEAPAAPQPIVPWSEPTVRAGAVGTGSYNNEQVVRHLLAHQFAMQGTPISPQSFEMDELIAQIAQGTLECELHMMAISVKDTSGPPPDLKPKINVDAKPGIRINLPINFAPSGWVRISQGLAQPYLYFAKVGLPFQCELALVPPGSTDDVVVRFTVPGGSLEVEAQIVAGKTVECVVPATAIDGPFSVVNAATQSVLDLARPHEEAPRGYADLHVAQ